MAVMVWGPTLDDFGELWSKEFKHCDDAILYIVDTLPEDIWYVIVISHADGSIITWPDIHRRYLELVADPVLLADAPATRADGGWLGVVRAYCTKPWRLIRSRREPRPRTLGDAHPAFS